MQSWIELSDPEHECAKARPERSQEGGRVVRICTIRQIIELTDKRFLPGDDPRRLTQQEFEIELRKLLAN